jgi:hypothetical protein
MIPSRYRQRGEGKVGCIVSLLVMTVLVATGLKAIPVYWGNNELKDAAKDAATRASVLKVESIELQLREKARDLGIAEALAPGAIKATKTGDNNQGTCTIRMRYRQKIDFYGVYQWTWDVSEDITSPYLNGA